MTTETNEERLERIKNKIVKEGPHSLDYWGFVHEDMKFLIEQAERAREFEDALLSWVNAKEKIKRKHEIVSKDFFEEREKRFDAEVKFEKLEKENVRLRKALEFYADEENYNVNTTNQWEPLILINQDHGELARQTLKGTSP